MRATFRFSTAQWHITLSVNNKTTPKSADLQIPKLKFGPRKIAENIIKIEVVYFLGHSVVIMQSMSVWTVWVIKLDIQSVHLLHEYE